MSESEVARRIAEALAQSEREGEEAMNDLLVCLGQVRGGQCGSARGGGEGPSICTGFVARGRG